MRWIVRFSVFLMIFFLLGCGKQPYLKEESVFIVLKTPSMRYADQGFVYENPDEVEVEIYSSGQPLLSLRITKDTVCTRQFQCLSPKAFNARVLSPYYPDDTIEAIFRGKALFGGKGVVKNRNGFTQKRYKAHQYDIDYRVFNNETVFRDTINHITIKIKKL